MLKVMRFSGKHKLPSSTLKFSFFQTMSSLDEIKAKIAVTEAKLEVAERDRDINWRNQLTTLLIKQQEEKNLLLADQSQELWLEERRIAAPPRPGKY